jgi:hypothetical protein
MSSWRSDPFCKTKRDIGPQILLIDQDIIPASLFYRYQFYPLGALPNKLSLINHLANIATAPKSTPSKDYESLQTHKCGEIMVSDRDGK